MVLSKAVDAFWRRGFEGTSIQDLVDETGIHRASLYDTYGSKEDLFREVVERYSVDVLETRFAPLRREGPARDVLLDFFDGVAEEFCDPETRGCLVVKSVLAVGEEIPWTRERAGEHVRRIDATFQDIIERGQRDGDLRADLDAPATARYLRNMLHGLVVGATIESDVNAFRENARLALRALS